MTEHAESQHDPLWHDGTCPDEDNQRFARKREKSDREKKKNSCFSAGFLKLHFLNAVFTQLEHNFKISKKRTFCLHVFTPMLLCQLKHSKTLTFFFSKYLHRRNKVDLL